MQIKSLHLDFLFFLFAKLILSVSHIRWPSSSRISGDISDNTDLSILRNNTVRGAMGTMKLKESFSNLTPLKLPLQWTNFDKAEDASWHCISVLKKQTLIGLMGSFLLKKVDFTDYTNY